MLYAREVISASGDDHIQATKASGWRAFHNALDPARTPELRIRYYPPTPAQQVAWTPDLSCPVVASVPGTENAGDGSCSEPTNNLASKPVEDTNGCPHLQLKATAATLDWFVDPIPENNIAAAAAIFDSPPPLPPAFPSPNPPAPIDLPNFCESPITNSIDEANCEILRKQMSQLPLPPPPPPGDLLDTNAAPPDWVRMAPSTWSPSYELPSRPLLTST